MVMLKDIQQNAKNLKPRGVYCVTTV